MTRSIRPKKKLFAISTGFALLFIVTATAAFAADFSIITKEELQKSLSKTDVVVLDVRTPLSWMLSFSKIPGAVREDPRRVETWKNKYTKDARIILYCQSDVTSSQVARKLAAAGFRNVFVLKGGWNGWARAKLPTEKK